jgi:hypothetical protein
MGVVEQSAPMELGFMTKDQRVVRFLQMSDLCAPSIDFGIEIALLALGLERSAQNRWRVQYIFPDRLVVWCNWGPDGQRAYRARLDTTASSCEAIRDLESTVTDLRVFVK